MEVDTAITTKNAPAQEPDSLLSVFACISRPSHVNASPYGHARRIERQPGSLARGFAVNRTLCAGILKWN